MLPTEKLTAESFKFKRSNDLKEFFWTYDFSNDFINEYQMFLEFSADETKIAAMDKAKGDIVMEFKFKNKLEDFEDFAEARKDLEAMDKKVLEKTLKIANEMYQKMKNYPLTVE